MNSDTQYAGTRFTTFPIMSKRLPATPSSTNECSSTSWRTFFPIHCAWALTASFVGNNDLVSAAWRSSGLQDAKTSCVSHFYPGTASQATGTSATRKRENKEAQKTHMFASAENFAAVFVNITPSYAS